MKKITVPVKDIVAGDVIEIENVSHIVLSNVDHPSGRIILGGMAGNHYPIIKFSRQEAAFVSVEVKRR